MICTKCSAEIPDNSVFCCQCGKRVARSARKPKLRGNGQGTAYRDGKTWTAQVVIGYREGRDGHQPIPIKRTKEGFAKKADALAYCAALKGKKDECRLTLQELYDLWSPWYSGRVDPETFGCYRAAFGHFSAIHHVRITDICAGDLQKCLDACPRGHRTHQNMKVTASLLWKYAADHNYVTRNIAENLYIGKGKSVKREPLTDLEVEKIRQAIPEDPYAEYVYALCYLGYRPGEMLEIRKEQVCDQNGLLYIVEGKKTDAGRDRIVPVHPKIESIIRRRLAEPGTDLLFPMRVTTRSGEFKEYRQMRDDYFNKFVFKPLAARLGIAHGKVPYSARHTFSNKLKKASGDSMDKARLIGHTDYAFTQEKYQSTTVEELRDIVNSMV